ncbi:MAG TPA: hypothetical protein VFV10_06450 [Gammaproteobacteria bacterium]|nr:hypothetical protein [Gammaproteobacteria bacterium]
MELNTVQRRGSVLALFVALTVLGTATLAALLPDRGAALDLQLAHTAEAFGQVIVRNWIPSNEGEGPNVAGNERASQPSFLRLRAHLVVDSVVFVPGYIGLLVFLTLLLAEHARVENAVAVHALCFVSVAAGFFDLGENGMTMQALDDFLAVLPEGSTYFDVRQLAGGATLLADGTVRDVFHASLVKWSLVAGSLVILSFLAAASWRRHEMPRRSDARNALARSYSLLLGALFAGIAAVALGLGVVAGVASDGRASTALLVSGSAAAGLALSAFVAWQALVLKAGARGRHSGPIQRAQVE